MIHAIGSSDYTFYPPRLHRFLDSRDVTFDESVSYNTRYPCQGCTIPSHPLFPAPAPPPTPAPPVHLTPPGPAPSGVYHATPLPSVAHQGPPPSPHSGVGVGGTGTRGATSVGAGAEGTGTRGASSGGAGVEGTGIRGAGTRGASFEGAGAVGAGTGGATSGGAGARAGGTTTTAPTPPPHRYGTRLQTLRRLEHEEQERLEQEVMELEQQQQQALQQQELQRQHCKHSTTVSFATVVPTSEWPPDSCPCRSLSKSVLPSPPNSSHAASSHPITDHYRTARPIVSRVLVSLVTDPRASTSSFSALVAAVGDSAASRHLDYTTCMVAARPLSIEVSTVDAIPPPGANTVNGMWIFRVKRPPGSPPVFKARYVARGFAQRNYELRSLNFSTAFLQGRLHEEIWLRRPPGFTGTFPPRTQ
ncbi:unnamed protein product [Closterium sp. NIES-53]